jgi:uncharacterized membrane protein
MNVEERGLSGIEVSVPIIIDSLLAVVLLSVITKENLQGNTYQLGTLTRNIGYDILVIERSQHIVRVQSRNYETNMYN